MAANGLGNAGLYPAAPYTVWPEIGHTQFKAVSTNGALVSDLPIDTQVYYNPNLNDLPVVGPGAKIGLAFDSGRHVTHMTYALRVVQQGSYEPMLSQSAADQEALDRYQAITNQGQVQVSS